MDGLYSKRVKSPLCKVCTVKQQLFLCEEVLKWFDADPSVYIGACSFVQDLEEPLTPLHLPLYGFILV